MAVYVDGLMHCIPSKRWPWAESCHLFADGADELHEFARALGLKREWFQERAGFHHYDLTAHMRAKALGMGARGVDRRFVVEFMRRGGRSQETQLNLF